MDTINEIKRQELPEEQEIDLIELAQKLWKERKFLLKGCGLFYGLRELSSSLFFLESCHKHIFYE